MLFVTLKGIFAFANAVDNLFLSSPSEVQMECITDHAATYIAENFPDNDFDLSEVYYIFKDNCYKINVQSRSSMDTAFSLFYDYKTFEFLRDNYESCVLSGYNTRTRLVEEYNARTREVIGAMPGAYIYSGDFCQYSEHTYRSSYFSPQGLDSATLILDYPYDVGVMGSQYGTIQVYFQTEEQDVTMEQLLERMLEVDAALTDAGLGYYVLDVRLLVGQYTADLYVYDVTPEDLHCEDPLARLWEIWEIQEAHRETIRNSKG